MKAAWVGTGSRKDSALNKARIIKTETLAADLLWVGKEAEEKSPKSLSDRVLPSIGTP